MILNLQNQPRLEFIREVGRQQKGMAAEVSEQWRTHLVISPISSLN